MLKAVIVACVISQPGVCTEFHDTMGPYFSERQCEQRVVNMSKDVYKYMKGYKTVSYTCNKLEKGKL
jgi:hypothetical protein